jgi:hypothetical protein
MSNLTVAIWGNKGAGTSTFCAALAQSLSKYFRSILLISGDMYQPAFSIWGVVENPIKEGKENLKMDSIGHILSCPDLTAEYIKKNVIVHPDNNCIGLMGYLANDDCERYSPVNGNAAQSLINIAKRFSQITIVDCTLPQTDSITDIALQYADIVITMLEPNPSGIGFVSAQNSYIARNLSDERKYIFMAAKAEPDSAIAQFEYQLGIRFHKRRLPYTHEAIEKLSRLELFRKYSGEYKETVDAIAEQIREEAEND